MVVATICVSFKLLWMMFQWSAQIAVVAILTCNDMVDEVNVMV